MTRSTCHQESAFEDVRFIGRVVLAGFYTGAASSHYTCCRIELGKHGSALTILLSRDGLDDQLGGWPCTATGRSRGWVAAGRQVAQYGHRRRALWAGGQPS